MALKSQQIADGALRMTVYDFEAAGDVLESHVHTRETAHYSIVASGAVKLFGAGQPEQIMGAGSMIRIEPGAAHGFSALAPRSRLINIVY
jgi:quercetin dioxygenase-like cupin family protein